MKSITILCALAAVLALSMTPPAFANQSSVTIEAPKHAEPGSQITIKVHVSHSGNNFFHYTNWVTVSADGQEIKRWEFSSGKRPEDADFTREVTYTVSGPVEITAEANCNMHGSAGKAAVQVQ